MIIETSVLNFKLSNTFEGNNTHMNKVEQLVMLREMVENISHKEKSLENSKRANVISQGLENILFDTVNNPERDTFVETSGHIYEGKIINHWISV